MRTRLVPTLALVLVVASLGVLACDVTSLIGGIGGAGSKPTVVIQSPANGSQFREGEEIAVQSTARDSSGVVRVELAVDGAAVRTDTPPVPQGQVSFTLVQKWKATSGSHTLSVRAFNASGAASEPMYVSITVAAGMAQATVPAGQPGAPTQPGGPIGSTLAPPATAMIGPTPVPATATLRRPTQVPPTSTPSAPPGVYAVSIRTDPAAPKRGQSVTFYVTFLNTTGSPVGYNWRIAIYEPDKRHAFGDTKIMPGTVPPGTSELASADNWAVRGPGDCMQLLARVFWIDSDSKEQREFIKPDGSGGPAAGFQVCP